MDVRLKQARDSVTQRVRDVPSVATARLCIFRASATAVACAPLRHAVQVTDEILSTLQCKEVDTSTGAYGSYAVAKGL